MRIRSIAAAAAMLLAAAPAFADLETKATIGYQGRWVVGAATPLVVSLTNSGVEPIAVALTVSDKGMVGAGEVVHRRIVRLEPGIGREEVFIVPGPQAWRGGVSVSLETDPEVPIHAGYENSASGSMTITVGEFNGNIAEGGMPFVARVIGVVGDARGSISARLTGLGFSSAGSRGNDVRRQIEAPTVAPELLRLAPLGLEGLDALLLCDPDAQTLADPATLEGVLDWVALGHTLVVSLGEHAAAARLSPLAAHLPATWTGAQRTHYASLLPDLGCGHGKGDLDAPWTVLTETERASAEFVPAHAGGPVRAVREFGMGRIVVLPFDLRTMLASQELTEDVTRKLLEPIVETSKPSSVSPEENHWNWRDNFSASVARVLQGDAFEPPPLPLVVIGIVLYVLVVGPVDWLLLKRLRKERLTTFTFLGAAAAFTLLAYGGSMFLFASGARVTRIVIADLADGGREGRQVLSFTDILGCYSATGSDQELRYTQPFVVVRSPLPGSNMDDAAATLPVQVVGSDPLRPNGVVPIKFRSQRVTRVNSAAAFGPTIEVEWDEKGGVRVTNGLPVDLDDVLIYTFPGMAFQLGPVKAGMVSQGGAFAPWEIAQDQSPDGFDAYDYGRRPPPTAAEVREVLEAISTGDPARTNDNAAALRKSGVERSGVFARGKALVVAHASAFPLQLPGSETEGATYVVFRKEVGLR